MWNAKFSRGNQTASKHWSYPNEMTLLSIGIGLMGARLFAAPKRSQHLLGSIFWLHSVLDGCDGELARLKFAESRWGGLIDFWGITLSTLRSFSAIAANLHAEKPGRTPSFGRFGGCGDATVRHPRLLHDDEGDDLERLAFHRGHLARALAEDHSNSIARIADQLARRDFIYLVIALAMLGKAKWFLRLGAIGAPLYFLVLSALSLKNSFPPTTPRKR